MTRFTRGGIALSVASFPVLLYALQTGPDPRYTNGPGDLGNCTACHGGTANTAGGIVTATFSSGATYIPGGDPVTITVNVTDPTNTFHGFQMSGRLASDAANGQAGRFTNLPGGGTIVICDYPSAAVRFNNCPPNSPVEFIEHSAPRTSAWTFTWTPPATNVGNVNFYIAGNAVNFNGMEDSGDHVYTNSYVLTPAGVSVNPTPDNALVLSQFVGGGAEWHTTLFITNLSNATEDFTLRFFDDLGLPKAMPMATLGSVDSIAGSLVPGQTLRYETGAAGNLVVTWALLTPASPTAKRLSGLAIFRQTVPSGATTVSSEAVVDFVPPTETKYVLLFDNLNGFDTTIMLANPDVLSTSTILADIRDEQGTVLASEQITLPPLGHTAFVLRERYATTVNRRGSIRLASSPRGFSGTGLRFSPFGTFTSFRLLTSADIQ